jgi:predicted amidohydrolase YtcJ
MADDVHDEAFDGSISRRELLRGAAAGAAFAAGGSALLAGAGPAGAAGGGKSQNPDVCDGTRDIVLHNGRFIDYRGVVASQITVKDGRIVVVDRGKDLGSCMQRINLRGRTVIPGLIDSHAHFTRTGTNPGYETRWIETVFSIAELQAAVAARAAQIPAGAFVTAAGGWNQNQLAEARLPTLAELDAATSTRAVYLNGRTNTLGAAFFAGFGITTDPVTGQVSSTGGATTALRSIQTFEDKVRGTADAIAYAAANGLTSIHDTSNLTIQPGDYAAMNTLYQRSGRSLDVRMRHYRYFGGDATVDQLRTYMDPIYREAGDETYRINGVGEQIGSAENYLEHLRAVAQSGWRDQQHTLSAADHAHHFEVMIQVGNEFDIGDLRWSLAHIPLATEQQILDLKAVGAGVTMQDWLYLSANPGPPFRMVYDTGIPVGAGTDSTNVAPLSPWLGLFYMTTGRNLAGVETNAGQKVTRLQALEMYTVGSAWFSEEENELGAFEVGKKCDLAVLSDDYLKVSDEKLREMTSLLTLQGGRVTHASGPFADLA